MRPPWHQPVRFVAGTLWVALAAISTAACAAPAGDGTDATPVDGRVIAFTGATLHDGAGGVIPDAVLLTANGRVRYVGAAEELAIENAEVVDLSGRHVVPGLINAHGHVGGTLGLEGGHYTTENLERQLALYARYGVTTVVSLGGDGPEGVALRDAEGPDLGRARLRVAGAVVSGTTPEEIAEVVAGNAALGVDFIKIRVDDNLGTSTKLTPQLYGAAIDAAHAAGLPLAAHLFYLEDAKGLLRAGADFLAHSIRDAPVDDEAIALFLDTGTCISPTLAREVSTFVYASEPDFFADPFFLRDADSAVLDQLRDPERQRRVRESPAATAYQRALEVAQDNLARLVEAGVPVAFGTDTGPPARFQGYFEHLEMELMGEAGLSGEQILRSATVDAAACLGLSELGTLTVGSHADFVVLRDDPRSGPAGLRSIESVWIAANRVPGVEAP